MDLVDHKDMYHSLYSINVLSKDFQNFYRYIRFYSLLLEQIDFSKLSKIQQQYILQASNERIKWMENDATDQQYIDLWKKMDEMYIWPNASELSFKKTSKDSGNLVYLHAPAVFQLSRKPEKKPHFDEAKGSDQTSKRSCSIL